MYFYLTNVRLDLITRPFKIIGNIIHESQKSHICQRKTIANIEYSVINITMIIYLLICLKIGDKSLILFFIFHMKFLTIITATLIIKNH